MSETKTIVCTRCGAKVETNGTGDFTTYVCVDCQEKANLSAYKAEVKFIEETQKGRDCIREFDKKLRLSGNKCNPGTTADLIATTLAICTLSGYRP